MRVLRNGGWQAELDKRRRQLEEHKRKAPLKKFKAKDVPLSTTEPRYHLMEAADVRRKQLRKHIVSCTGGRL